jgi:hypothetical protein
MLGPVKFPILTHRSAIVELVLFWIWYEAYPFVRGGDSDVSRYRVLADVRVTLMLLLAQLGVGVAVGVRVAVGAAVGGAAQEVALAKHVARASAIIASHSHERLYLTRNMDPLEEGRA